MLNEGTRTMTTIADALPTTIGTASTTRTTSQDLRAVPAALRSEWIKLTTLRTNKVMLALTGAITALIAWALATSTKDPTLVAAELFIYPLPLVAMLAAVTGILMFTAEVQHGTLPVTLITRPARWVTVTAKTIMAGAVGLTFGAVAMVVGFGGAALGGVELGIGSGLVTRALWALLYISLATIIGLGVGMIVRHGAGAISGLLLWSFVLENLFAPALPDGVVHFLPFSAGYRLLDAGPNFEAPVQITNELSRPLYAAIFGGYAVICLLIGTFLLYRRDGD